MLTALRLLLLVEQVAEQSSMLPGEFIPYLGSAQKTDLTTEGGLLYKPDGYEFGDKQVRFIDRLDTVVAVAVGLEVVGHIKMIFCHFHTFELDKTAFRRKCDDKAPPPFRTTTKNVSDPKKTIQNVGRKIFRKSVQFVETLRGCIGFPLFSLNAFGDEDAELI
jgi:hypothetical protein